MVTVTSRPGLVLHSGAWIAGGFYLILLLSSISYLVKVMKKVQQDPGLRILFTGPDGIGDYRPRMDYFPRSIGVGSLSPDATSDLQYLFRPGPQATPPLPKHRYTGEVGWGLQYSYELNRRAAVSGGQKQLDRFQSVADGVTHSQWNTPPQFQDKQPPCGRLHWNHSTHDTYSEDNNKQLPPNKRQSTYTEKDQVGVTFPQTYPESTLENDMRP